MIAILQSTSDCPGSGEVIYLNDLVGLIYLQFFFFFLNSSRTDWETFVYLYLA